MSDDPAPAASSRAGASIYCGSCDFSGNDAIFGRIAAAGAFVMRRGCGRATVGGSAGDAIWDAVGAAGLAAVDGTTGAAVVAGSLGAAGDDADDDEAVACGAA